MNGNLLDTNVVVRILNGDKSLVQQLIDYNNICTCSVVLGELLYGAEKSSRVQENKNKAQSFCSNFEILSVDEKVSESYGVLKNKLLSQGKVLPENDMWIAAIAIANNVSVITQDKHFEEIENISVIKI